MSKQRVQKVQRRRGEELQLAIYTAAREIFEEEGYEALNFQKVAQRAHTSRSVLYRKWESPFELLFEALRYISRHETDSITEISFDTGSLRGDLLALCQRITDNGFPRKFMPVVFLEIANGRQPIDDGVAEMNLEVMDKILAQATARGEVKANLTDTAKLVPFKLLRYQLFFEKELLSEVEIAELVDQVLLPIYKIC